MLPNFRSIAVTFLCGFFVVFAGLRLVTSLHDTHGALPVTAAQAAPMPTTAIAGQEMRSGQAAMPVMYDLRFVVSAASLAPVTERMTARTIDRTVPVALPLVITPPLQESAGNDWAPTAAVAVKLTAISAPDTAEVESPATPAMITAVLDQDSDASATILVDVPMPRAAKRPPLADKKIASNKPAGTKRRIASQASPDNIPLINIFSTPPDHN